MKALTFLLLLASSAPALASPDSYKLSGNTLILNGQPAVALQSKLENKTGENYSCDLGSCEFHLGDKISFSVSMPEKPDSLLRLTISGEGVNDIFNELFLSADYGLVDGAMRESKKIWHGYGKDPVVECVRTSSPGWNGVHTSCQFLLRQQ